MPSLPDGRSDAFLLSFGFFLFLDLSEPDEFGDQAGNIRGIRGQVVAERPNSAAVRRAQVVDINRKI
jgi:hypothetical protein